MAEELLTREEVPVELTWDLSLLYGTEADFLADVEKMERLAGEIARDYPGKLDRAEPIAACMEKYREFYMLAMLTSSYTSLAVSVDYYNEENQKRDAGLQQKIAALESELSFVKTQIAQADVFEIEGAMKLTQSCAGYLREICRYKPHQLHPEAERALAALSVTTQLPYTVYEAAKLADMKFDPFTVDGKTYPLGYSLFEDDYEYDPRTPVRRAAFGAFYAKLREYENVTAAAYNGEVQCRKTISALRGFDTLFDSDLFADQVTREMYDRQIDLIMEKLAPHMRKYAALLARVHKLDRMTYADLKLPVDPDYSPDVTIGEAWEYIEKGLSIMGEDYVEMIRTARRERWVDFAKNKGKSTGGFCASPYGRNSFILLTWNGKMSDVFTLAHELGHAGHFRLCNAAQSIFDAEVEGYFVEAPSTMNEVLLAHYLLQQGGDKRFRRWVLANLVSNTYYHNFVTHLLEAAYQREVYRLAEAGESVQAGTLSRLFGGVLKKFWGDAVELLPGSELTWMRQPHYYMGLYSYVYSAGLTIGTQVCKRLEREGAGAVADWKRVLAAGCTKTPVELAAMAGVDITTPAPLLDTIDTIGAYIDEIVALTDELEKEGA